MLKAFDLMTGPNGVINLTKTVAGFVADSGVQSGACIVFTPHTTAGLTITSFWDHWANQWSGVHKEELPALSSDAENGYCIIAVHKKYADMPYVITSTDGKPHEGSC